MPSDVSYKPYSGQWPLCWIARSGRHSFRQAGYGGVIPVHFFVTQSSHSARLNRAVSPAVSGLLYSGLVPTCCPADTTFQPNPPDSISSRFWWSVRLSKLWPRLERGQSGFCSGLHAVSAGRSSKPSSQRFFGVRLLHAICSLALVFRACGPTFWHSNLTSVVKLLRELLCDWLTMDSCQRKRQPRLSVWCGIHLPPSPSWGRHLPT
ncbi:hypothetical protein MRX96_039617 [Rhipicephalus microplus]